MFFKSNNNRERLETFILVLFVVPFFNPLMDPEIALTTKLVLGVLCSFFILFPFYLYVFQRYEIVFEEDFIRINYSLKSKKQKVFTYDDVEKIRCAKPHRGMDFIQIKFRKIKGEKSTYRVELVRKELLTAMIINAKTKNKKIKITIATINGELRRYVNSHYTIYKRKQRLKC